MKDEGFETIEQNLRRLKNIKPEVPFRDGLRLRLVEKLGGVSVPTQVKGFGWRIAFTISLVVIFLAGGSVVLAGNSLPGHPLYPVKRGVENVKLIFVSKKDKPEVEKRLADTRIEELKEAVQVENEEATSFALNEVEQSINKISLQVISARNSFKALSDPEEDTQPARQTLEELLLVLREKEAKLAEIERSIPESEQARLKLIRENLETLRSEIENDLNPPEESEELPVQGVDTKEEGAPQDPPVEP